MKRINLLAVTALLLFVSLLAPLGCARQIKVAPYVPPSYYEAIEVSPHDLVMAYYPPYTDSPVPMGYIEDMYNNKVYIFKGIRVTTYMLQNAANGVAWVDLIKCSLMVSDSLSRLKVGDVVDVIGLNEGLCPDRVGFLQFSGCVFIPSGALQIPAAGSTAFVPPY
jgi:hypothetical protein